MIIVAFLASAILLYLWIAFGIPSSLKLMFRKMGLTSEEFNDDRHLAPNRIRCEEGNDEGRLSPNGIARKGSLSFAMVTKAVTKMRALRGRNLNQEVAEQPHLDGVGQQKMHQQHDVV